MMLEIIVKHTDDVKDYSKTYWYDWRSTVKNNNKQKIDLFRQSHKNVIFRGRFVIYDVRWEVVDFVLIFVQLLTIIVWILVT